MDKKRGHEGEEKKGGLIVQETASPSKRKNPRTVSTFQNTLNLKPSGSDHPILRGHSCHELGEREAQIKPRSVACIAVSRCPHQM